MLGQVGWGRLCPWGPALLLLLLVVVVGARVTAQDICSSPGDGHLPAPHLSLDLPSVQPGDTVLAWCSLLMGSPATRIVFCKDGVEEYSLKAQRGQLSYFVLLNITLGSAGMYTCGYQHRNDRNWVRSSALSAPRHLAVTGSGSSSQAGPWTTDPPPRLVLPFPTGIALAVAAVSLLLLAAATYCAVKKGACRERCQSAEDSSADDQSYYANADEVRRVKVSRPKCSEDSLYANL